MSRGFQSEAALLYTRNYVGLMAQLGYSSELWNFFEKNSFIQKIPSHFSMFSFRKTHFTYLKDHLLRFSAMNNFFRRNVFSTITFSPPFFIFDVCTPRKLFRAQKAAFPFLTLLTPDNFVEANLRILSFLSLNLKRSCLFPQNLPGFNFISKL